MVLLAVPVRQLIPHFWDGPGDGIGPVLPLLAGGVTCCILIVSSHLFLLKSFFFSLFFNLSGAFFNTLMRSSSPGNYGEHIACVFICGILLTPFTLFCCPLYLTWVFESLLTDHFLLLQSLHLSHLKNFYWKGLKDVNNRR